MPVNQIIIIAYNSNPADYFYICPQFFLSYTIALAILLNEKTYRRNYAHKKYSTEDYIAVCAASHNFIIDSPLQFCHLNLTYHIT